MKKTLLNILAVLVIVGITFGATRQFFPKTKQVVKTDTVRVDVPYEVTKIKEKEVPIQVTKWKTDTVTVEKVRLEKDTVFVTTPDNTFLYNTQFLLQFPQAPKFLGLRNTQGEVELTYLETTGQTTGQTWNVGQQDYRIGLNDGQPSLETLGEPTEFNWYGEVGLLTFSNSLKTPSLYLELSAEMSILGIDVKGTANVNKNPFAKIGIQKEF